MNRIASFRIFVLIFAALAFYVLMSAVLPGPVLIELFNGLFIGLVAGVSIVFFPLAVRMVKAKDFDRISQFALGIFCIWSAFILLRGVSIVSRITGDVAGSPNWQPVAFAAYLASIGAVLHITAPGMLDGELKYNKRLLLTALAAGSTIALVAIYLQRRYG